jgi:hypothetical protein
MEKQQNALVQKMKNEQQQMKQQMLAEAQANQKSFESKHAKEEANMNKLIKEKTSVEHQLS